MVVCVSGTEKDKDKGITKIQQMISSEGGAAGLPGNNVNELGLYAITTGDMRNC